MPDGVEEFELHIGSATELFGSPDEFFGACHGCNRTLSVGEVAGWHPDRSLRDSVILQGYCEPCLADLLATMMVRRG